MADFVKLITNQIGVYGPSVASQWGVMVWGVDYWAQGMDLTTSTNKVIQNSVIPSDDYLFDSSHFISNEVIFDSETTFESLQDEEGYFYVFVKPTLDAEEQDKSIWSES